MFCGHTTISEEAYCYTKGSKCERWHRQGKSLRSFGTNEIPDTKTSKDVTYPKKGKVQGNCGKRENSKPFGRRGPWALRILGKL